MPVILRDLRVEGSRLLRKIDNFLFRQLFEYVSNI